MPTKGHEEEAQNEALQAYREASQKGKNVPISDFLMEGTIKTKKSPLGSRKAKILAFLLWLFYGFYFIPATGMDEDVAEQIISIASLGMLAVLFSRYLGRYKGPMWTVGRIGTYIDRPSPPLAFEILGWVFLVIPLIILLVIKMM